MKRKWLKAFMLALMACASFGSAMNPKEIEDLMYIMNQTRIEFTVPDEDDNGEGEGGKIRNQEEDRESFLGTVAVERTALNSFFGYGGENMKRRIFVGLFLCSLFIVVGGDAKSPNNQFSGYMRADGEKPVWALEFVKVQPENFALTMEYLDDHWMRVRAEAKRRGAVLDYHLISNGGIVTPGHNASDQDSIVLLTKYKNMDALIESQHTRLPIDNGFRFGELQLKKDDLFEPLNAQVFVEEPETSTGLKLLTKQ